METTTLIKQDGKVQFLGKTLDFIIQMLRNGTYTVVIKKKSERRSISQNSLMWMWFTAIADATGDTRDNVHDGYCAMFLPKNVSFRGMNITVPGETKHLTTAEFTDFLNKVQADAQTELGIVLPSPDDLIYEEFYQTYKNRI